MWHSTITYNGAVPSYNCWRQVFHINTKYSYALIIDWNKLYSNKINELFIDALKELSSGENLLYFSFSAWVSGWHTIYRRNRCYTFNYGNKSKLYFSRSIMLF